MGLVDTHCHIHSSDYPLPPDRVIQAAQAADVTHLLCVGTTLADSQLATQFVQSRASCWASIGLHPHEAKDYVDDARAQASFASLATAPKVVAIGECGLDYYYTHSPKKAQAQILEFQLQLAQTHHLPLIFHVREAFDDFWPIFDRYPGLRGVIHSFSATSKQLHSALERGLYIGLNGIMTFTKDPLQLAAAKEIPLDKLLLETDAPFLTPTPFRGTICESKHVRVIAEFLSDLRGEPFEELATVTTRNAQQLFKLQ